MTHAQSVSRSKPGPDLSKFVFAYVRNFSVPGHYGIAIVDGDRERTVMFHEAQRMRFEENRLVPFAEDEYHKRPSRDDRIGVLFEAGYERGAERAAKWFLEDAEARAALAVVVDQPQYVSRTATFVEEPPAERHDPKHWFTISLKVKPGATRATHYARTESGRQIAVSNKLYSDARFGKLPHDQRFKVQCVEGDGMLVATVIKRS